MRHAVTHEMRRTCTPRSNDGPPGVPRPRRRGVKRLLNAWDRPGLADNLPRARSSAPSANSFALPPPSSDAAQPKLTRVCRKCGVEKPIAEFYLNYATGRRTSPCRRCIRAANRRYYAENRERLIPIRRRWAAQEDPEQRRARMRRYRERHPREQAIRSRTNRLRVLGILELAAECADCRGPATDLHHETYGSVCALVSLCRRCHMARHFRHWRKHGGGPVRYPWEHEQEEDLPAKHAKGREKGKEGISPRISRMPRMRRRRGPGVEPEDGGINRERRERASFISSRSSGFAMRFLQAPACSSSWLAAGAGFQSVEPCGAGPAAPLSR